MPVSFTNEVLVGVAGQLDELSVYPFPLETSQILAAGKERVFYLKAEEGFGLIVENTAWSPRSIQDSSEFRNTIICRNNDPDNPNGQPVCPASSDNGGIIDRYYQFINSDDFDTIPLDVVSSPNLDLSKNNGEFTIALWADPSENPGSAGKWMGNGAGKFLL